MKCRKAYYLWIPYFDRLIVRAAYNTMTVITNTCDTMRMAKERADAHASRHIPHLDGCVT